jgi:hypothetical protein
MNNRVACSLLELTSKIRLTAHACYDWSSVHVCMHISTTPCDVSKVPGTIIMTLS